MAYALVALYLLLIAPVCLTATVSMASGTPGGVLRLTVFGMGARLFFVIGREDSGTLTIRLRTKKGGREHAPDAYSAVRRLLVLRRALKDARAIRALLRKALTVARARGDVAIACADASATAVLCGLARTVLPEAVSVRADFSGGRTRAQGMCIITAKLGSLVACALLILCAYGREMKRWKDTQSAA